jgi:lysophospholipase L1-like esterase
MVVTSLALMLALASPAQSLPPGVMPIDQRPPAKPIVASKIIIVGDSTMQVGSGWGGSFCNTHVTSFAACVNLARGGRSSYSYRAEGSWDLALAEMRTPGFVHTWVLIQLGHNDMPGKAERSTDLKIEFPANIRRYVEEARAAGAIPVLITPLTRRSFEGGRLIRDLEPWAEAIRKVAAETNAPLFDLTKVSGDAVQAMGPVAALRFAEVPPPTNIVAAARTGTTIDAPKPAPRLQPVLQPNQPPPMGRNHDGFDYTHLGAEGAEYFAKMVVVGLAEKLPGMRPYLIP